VRQHDRDGGGAGHRGGASREPAAKDYASGGERGGDEQHHGDGEK
jgi:hypothetical protein